MIRLSQEVTREQFEAFAELCRRNDSEFKSSTGLTFYPGIEVRGDKGVAGHNGYELSWEYADGKLTVDCIKAPFLFPVELVETAIQELLELAVESTVPASNENQTDATEGGPTETPKPEQPAPENAATGDLEPKPSTTETSTATE